MLIEYRPFHPDDAESLSQFTKRFLDPQRPSLRRSLQPEYYLWRNYRNPAGEGKIFLAWVQGRMVGCFAITPKRVLSFGKVWLAAEMDDAFVDPSYQGHGIFRRMVEMAVEEAGRQGVRFLYGTPNETSYPIFLHRLDFEEPPSCHVWLVVSACAPFGLVPPLSMDPVPAPASGHAAFEVLHDPEYLHWRFSENPDSYEWIDSQLVLKEGLWGRHKIGYLADQLPGRGDRTALLRALQAARRHFARRGVPLVAGWVQTSILSRLTLWVHGFVPCYRKPVVFRSLDPAFVPKALPGVHFLMADSDNI
jgi:GNAT superfamily N-acetyltransferase